MLRPRGPRRATYRLQLHAGFGFGDAAGIAGYLAELGISHVYLSPMLQAAKAARTATTLSIRDRQRELGGEPAARARSHAPWGVGWARCWTSCPTTWPSRAATTVVVGRARKRAVERYAGYFDVDWGPPDNGHADPSGAVLLPFLADHYGRELEAGRFHLEHDRGSFTLRYFDQQVPIAPRSLDQLVARAARHLPRSLEASVRAELESIGTALGRLPPSWATDRASVKERHRDKEVLRARLEALCTAHPEVGAALDDEAQAVGDNPDALDALLQRQNYRLAFWRTASEEGQYRRFFDINELVGIRVEDDESVR